MANKPDNAQTVMWLLIVVLLIPPLTPIGLVLLILVVAYKLLHPQR